MTKSKTAPDDGDVPRQMSKVRYDGKRVRIEYLVEQAEGKPDEYTLGCSEAPDPEFEKALAVLAPFAAELLEVQPAKEWAQAFTVRGVTFSWTYEIMGASILVSKQLKQANAPWNISTPHKPAEPYARKGSGQEEDAPAETAYCLSKLCVKALRRLIDAANDYVNGKRAQGSLEFGGEGEAA